MKAFSPLCTPLIQCYISQKPRPQTKLCYAPPQSKSWIIKLRGVGKDQPLFPHPAHCRLCLHLPTWVSSPSTETHPALLPMKEGKINDSNCEDCACLTLQSFREINLDIKQEVILCVAERDLREVIAPRYFKAKVWGSISQTSAWIRVTWRAY